MTNQELMVDFVNFKNSVNNALTEEFSRGFNEGCKMVIELIRREFPAPIFNTLAERIIQEFSRYTTNKEKRDPYDQR